MQNKPLVISICIPTYNRAKCLQILLNDIYNEFSNFPFSYELIISNNASSDDTDAVVESWSTKLPILYIKQGNNIGSSRSLEDAFANASGIFSMYLADDDFLDCDGLADAILMLIRNPEAAVLYAPWKLIRLQNKASNQQFYEVPTDLVFDQGDYKNLLSTILNHHIFLEISIFRNSYYQELRRGYSEIAYWSFTIPAEWISVGQVLIMRKPFYYASIQYFEDEKLEQAGNLEVEHAWDVYRGGMEYLLGRALATCDEEEFSNFKNRIQEFVADRMIVGLKMRILNNRNPIENYYLAARLCGLGKKEQLPVSYDYIRTEAAIWYLCNNERVLNNKSSIVLVGEFEEEFVLKVKENSGLKIVINKTYSKGIHNHAILLFQGDFNNVDFKIEKMRDNEVWNETRLLNKFL